MWFKQLSFYPVNPDNLPPAEAWTAKLGEAAFAPVQGLDRFSEGFAAPYSFCAENLFAAEHTYAFALKKEERVLPAGVIRDVLEQKIADIAEKEGRSVGKKEKQELKEQITDDLLPRAFTRSGRTCGLFDTRRHFLLVNHASPAKAENLLTKLRGALGGLEARLPQTKISPQTLMTEWLARGFCEDGFTTDSSCELKGTGDIVPTVRISGQDLGAEEVLRHLQTGKNVTRLGLVWRDRLSFVLNDNLTLTRIRYLDLLQEEAEQYGEDAESTAFAAQLITAEALGTMLEELVSHLGGWQK